MFNTSTNLTSRFTPGRYGVEIDLIGIHSMEAEETLGAAESVAEYFKTVDASSHWCVDANSRVRVVNDEDMAWTLPGANPRSLNLEFAGYAKQVEKDWLEPYSKAMLDIGALCCAEWVIKYDIPIRRLTDAQIEAGEKGFVGHIDVNRVYKKSNHWDPGYSFPWTYFLKRVEAYVTHLRGGEAVVPIVYLEGGTNMAVMVSPAEGRVTSEYGMRTHPVTGVRGLHAGIDVANDEGTPIRAAFAGKIKAAGANIVSGRTGNGILIENPDGEGQYYGHLSRIDVAVGQAVKAGQRIGLMGDTGKVTGSHLHFEIWEDADNHQSSRNPRIDFEHFNIAPGSKPIGEVFLPLNVDGDFGHRSITELERALAKIGDYTGMIEEDHGREAEFGPELWKGVQRFLQRHKYYTFGIDGQANEGGATKKGLQEFLRDTGDYTFGIDGLMPAGGDSWKSLQKALNEGDVRNGRATKVVTTTPTKPTTPTTPPTTPTTPPTIPPVEIEGTIEDFAKAVVDEMVRRLSRPD